MSDVANLRRNCWLLALAAVGVCAARSQSGSGDQFEVASVRVSDGKGQTRMAGGPGSRTPGRFIAQNCPLYMLIASGFSSGPQSLEAPSWTNTTRVDVTAKFLPSTTREQFSSMVRNLLESRFALTVHHESKEIRGYDLTARVGANKLKPSSKESSRVDAANLPRVPFSSVKGHLQIDVVFETMAQFAKLLSGRMNAPVTDVTGITGQYDILLEFAPDTLSRGAETDPSSDNYPVLSTVLQEQLGFKLLPKKIAVDVTVVDHLLRVPVEN